MRCNRCSDRHDLRAGLALVGIPLVDRRHWLLPGSYGGTSSPASLHIRMTTVTATSTRARGLPRAAVRRWPGSARPTCRGGWRQHGWTDRVAVLVDLAEPWRAPASELRRCRLRIWSAGSGSSRRSHGDAGRRSAPRAVRLIRQHPILGPWMCYGVGRWQDASRGRCARSGRGSTGMGQWWSRPTSPCSTTTGSGWRVPSRTRRWPGCPMPTPRRSGTSSSAWSPGTTWRRRTTSAGSRPPPLSPSSRGWSRTKSSSGGRAAASGYRAATARRCGPVALA